MGIKITTDAPVKVWRDDKNGFANYRISIGSKDREGKWVNFYQDVRFKRGVEFENGEEINIVDAFPTVRVWDGGKKQIWQVMEYSYANKQKQEKKSDYRPDMFDDLPDAFSAAEDEIPF